MKKMTKFTELGLDKPLLDMIEDIGFTTPFPIQERAIPVLLEGNDVIGQAHTGTGKTAAYFLPMLQLTVPKQGIQGIIMAPTRELAIQITTEINKFAKNIGIRTVTIYGGQGMGIQFDALRKKPEILVATPGRLIDHLKRGTIKLNNIKHVVLDEADVMLDMGFIDDIQFILDLTPDNRNTSLWSATMPPEIMRLAETNMNMPKRILVDSDDLSGAGIQQSFLVLRDKEKSKFLLDFIHGNIGQCIVFCSTKIRTRNVAKMLSQSGERCVTVEGDMSQHKREDSMTRFRKSKTDILVATDVAARGIDIPQVALVINYDVPNQDMIYFHRIGRTARAGAKGRAITLVSYSSVGEWNQIKKQTSVKMTDLNEQLGIKVKIPDPLKRQGGMRQHFRQNNSTSKPFYKKRVIARDQYARKKKNAGYVKRSNFSQKKRW
jgi:ATP-dependent RNA helicase DeaD